jgi:hypothetical protein
MPPCRCVPVQINLIRPRSSLSFPPRLQWEQILAANVTLLDKSGPSLEQIPYKAPRGLCFAAIVAGASRPLSISVGTPVASTVVKGKGCVIVKALLGKLAMVGFPAFVAGKAEENTLSAHDSGNTGSCGIFCFSDSCNYSCVCRPSCHHVAHCVPRNVWKDRRRGCYRRDHGWVDIHIV